MEERKSIVVLIDSENFAIKYFKILKNELDEIGDIVVVRAYGNFDSKIKKEFLELGINPILQPPYTTGKNATDIRMVIEAMEFLSKGFYDCFCLATSDSDFTPLAIRLKEERKYVIGAGKGTTPSPLKNTCHKFINVDEIFNALNKEPIVIESKETIKEVTTVIKAKDALKTISKKTKTENKNNNSNNTPMNVNKIYEIVLLINDIIESRSDEEGYALFAYVIEILTKNKTDFNPKNYGATSSQALPFFKKFLNQYYTLKQTDSSVYIKIKKA